MKLKPGPDPKLSNIVLMGPTGSGKSAFSLTLEKKVKLRTMADQIVDNKGIIGNSA